jgi:hypothetical protein
MNKQRKKPNGWIYGLIALIPVLGCLLTMAAVYYWFPNIPENLDTKMNLDMKQVVVPGSEDINFPEKGAYGVYYEYRSVVDGVVYESSETPPNLVCSLISKASGEDIGTAPDYVKTNTYATQRRERVGVLIQSITIKEPGIYTFSCSYANNNSRPEIVLAVGPNHVWEFFRILAKCGIPVFVGLILVLGSVVVAIATAIVVAVKHR